jgi:hypothetical protein
MQPFWNATGKEGPKFLKGNLSHYQFLRKKDNVKFGSVASNGGQGKLRLLASA